jgi:ankyrin repeat protein
MGRTPLLWAGACGMTAVGAGLLEAGAGIDLAMTRDRCSPLIEACRKGHMGVVKLLIARGADVNHRNRLGLTPLHFACLGVGANIALKKFDSGVIIPGSNALPELVGLLVESGADVNAATRDGFTPLMAAAQEGYLSIVRALLDAGGDPAAVTKQGTRAVDLAVQEGRFEIADLLEAT